MTSPFGSVSMSATVARGTAIQTGLVTASGDVIVIQDAGLLQHMSLKIGRRMYDLIAHRKVADVVYGSRFYGGRTARFILIIISATGSSCS